MSKVVVVSTGGTIAMRHIAAQGGVVPAANGHELMLAVPALNETGPVEVIEFSNIPSFYSTPEAMLHLAQDVESILARHDVTGVVVTHGTDTLEETAYFLSLYLSSVKPVCLTGAMRYGNAVSPDGPYNMYSAVLAASSPLLHGYGTVVVMNGEIHDAEHVTKMHKSALHAFSSSEHGLLGYIDGGTVSVYREAPHRTRLCPCVPLPMVPLVKVYPGMDLVLFDALLTAPMKGVVIEGFGLGNVPATIVPYLETLIKKNKVVVVTSRVPLGKTAGVYAAPGGAGHLRSLGVVLGGSLNSHKARLKLMLLLAQEQPHCDIQNFFAS